MGSRRRGVSGALGVATGTALWVCVAAFGLTAALKSSPAASAAVRGAGGLYLLSLAWKLARGARSAAAPEAPARFAAGSAAAAYAQGLATNATNPGTALFFTALLGLYRVEELPRAAQAAVYVGIPLLAAGWYGSLALAFSSARLSRAYRRLSRPLDAALAVVFFILAAKLLASL